MIIISFKLPLKPHEFDKLKMVIPFSKYCNNIFSFDKTIQCDLIFRDELVKAEKELEDLRKLIEESKNQTANTFAKILSAVKAEILAIEEPLSLILEKKYLTIKKSIDIDVDSIEIEQIFRYLGDRLIALLCEWLPEGFETERLKAIIDEE